MRVRGRAMAWVALLAAACATTVPVRPAGAVSKPVPPADCRTLGCPAGQVCACRAAGELSCPPSLHTEACEAEHCSERLCADPAHLPVAMP